MIDLRAYDLAEREAASGAVRIPRCNDLRNAAKCEAIEEWARERLAEQPRMTFLRRAIAVAR